MEKPLDLSQREEAEMGNAYLPDRDEPICQVTNCNCPLKHIMLLDSPKSLQNKTEKNSTDFNNTYDQSPRAYDKRSSDVAETFVTLEAGSSQGKRSNDVEFNTVQLHPKRRRMEMYNKSMTKSCSNGDLKSFNVEEESSEANGFSNSLVNNAYRNSENSDENFGSSIRKDAPCHRDRRHSMSNAHIQRLPKKRVQVRRNSPETVTQARGRRSPKDPDINSFISPEISSLASVSPHDKFKGQLNARPTCMTSLPAVTALPPTSTVSKPQDKEEQCAKNSLTSKTSPYDSEAGKSANNSSYDLKSLKAEMMKEIDLANERGEEEDEDVKPKRGNIFFSRRKVRHHRGKSVDQVTNISKYQEGAPSKAVAGDSKKLQSLDYMILTTLMQSEEQPFKARNNHIHEIIRGEKRGKLCLMDLVELQVEMGLA